MKEIYKPIPYFEDYLISNYGRVKSIKHKNPKIIKTFKCKYGYHRIKLYKNGKRYNKSINRLVLETFQGFCDEKDVNHKDRNKDNNFLSNLEYLTKSENQKHWRKIEKEKNINVNN